MAAVMATTSGRRSAIRTSSRPKTEVKDGPAELFSGRPVAGSIGLTAWPRSSSFRSVTGKPRPFSVTTCTTTGRRSSRARRSATSSAVTSCPSTGPR
ncbi:hypothetical protein SFUMM280S_03143 [Streptomyces fumanus]